MQAQSAASFKCDWCRTRQRDAQLHRSEPDTGAVIRGSGGVRKVRWLREGTGKSGGIRIVYLTRNEAGEVYLLTLYAKSKSENISLAFLKEIRRALET